MSEQTLEVIQGGRGAALDRVVADAKKMEEHEEVDRWQFSDDVLEAVGDLAPRNGFGVEGQSKFARTGLYEAIEQVSLTIKEAGVVSIGRDAIVGAYKTAQAWPSEIRVENATYWAHYELRGQEYAQTREKSLRRLAARGRVGPKDVRLWKSSRRPSVVTPFLAQVENRVRGALKRGVVWNQLADGDRDAIVQILQAVAREIDSGSFGL